MTLNNLIKVSCVALSATFIQSISAQECCKDSASIQKLTNSISRLHIGGYGEAAFSRNFYSDHVSRYSQPNEHKNDPSHGRFDIPHAVVFLGYDFGNGWSFNSEIEFEHGGTGTAYEKEDEEGGEWESETEKGGEVELEQFYIQKSFCPEANIRAGHLVVPVGLNNAHHEPLNFFTVYRPQGENTILPSTWHQTGIDFWGRYGDWRYQIQLLAGLNSDNFSTVGWVHDGPQSPLEFEVATKYGTSLRIDNYSVPGLRLGLSGYYGHSIGNSYPNNKDGVDATYKGVVAIGSFDFTYDDNNWIVRGQADYGYIGDVKQLNYVYNRTNKKSPYHHSTPVSQNAYAVGIEAGYDIFSQIEKTRKSNQKLYVFGRYEQYNSCASSNMNVYDYNDVKRMAFGLNYFPVNGVVIKGDYSHNFLKSQYNNEPSINLGVAFMGWFM